MFFQIQNDSEYGFQFAMLSLFFEPVDPDLPEQLREYQRTQYGTYLDRNNEDKTEEYHLLYIDYLKSKYGDSSLKLAKEYIEAASFMDNPMQYLDLALGIYNKTLGPTHTTTLECHSIYLYHLADKKRYKEGRDYFLQVLQPLTCEVYDQMDPFFENLYANVAICFKELGQREEALEYFKKYSEILKKEKGQDPIYLAYAYKEIGELLVSFNEKSQALPYLREAINTMVLQEDANDYSGDIKELYELGISYGLCDELLRDLVYAIYFYGNEHQDLLNGHFLLLK